MQLRPSATSYLDRLQRVKICGASLVDVENLLGVPDHSGQVAGQDHL